MPKYTYLGHEVNLGRFGTVRRGDMVNLTDKEEESILENKDTRFQPFDEKKKVEWAGVRVPEGFTDLKPAEQKKVIEKLERDERRRQEDLGQATDPRAGISGRGATGQPTDEATEQARRERLERANEQTDAESLREKTKAELLEVKEEMERQGAEFPNLNSKSTRGAILRELLIAKGHTADDVADEEEEKQ